MSDSKRFGRRNKRFFSKDSIDEENNTEMNEMVEDDNDKHSEVIDSDFVNLDELVYAPLHALAESDQNLRMDIIDTIKALSKRPKKNEYNNNGEETIHLDTLNIVYDQVRTDEDDKYRLDTLQVRVPLMSVVPITNLGIEKSEIDFAVEVRSQEGEDDDQRRFEARICSPEQRDSDFLPRVSYKIKVKSIPATEGVMRLVDSLSANQVAKILKSRGVDYDGNPDNNNKTEIDELKSRVAKLKQIYSKIDEVTDDMDHMNQIKNTVSEKDEDSFADKKTAILDEIIKCQDEIMKKEISNVISEESD